MSDHDFPGVPPERPDLEIQPGQPLPLFCRREGIEVVVIRSDEYRELIGLRARAAREEIRAVFQERKGPPPGLSTIEKDAEVADFLRDLFRGRMTLAALHEACVERFGAVRAPSASRIHVFRARWRKH
jgi:DNA invertase Pin-like site-specific DNA recombinase